MPRFAVGNRRVLRTAAGDIQCGFTPAPPGAADLTRALADRLADEVVARGEVELADGTPAVWVTTGGPAGAQRAGLAWSCGEGREGFSRYLALVDGDAAALARLAQRLRCA